MLILCISNESKCLSCLSCLSFSASLERLRKRLTHCDWPRAMQWPSPWRHHNDPKPRRKCLREQRSSWFRCHENAMFSYVPKWNLGQKPSKTENNVAPWETWRTRGNLCARGICTGTECKTLGSG